MESYSQWNHKETDTTEQLSLLLFTSKVSQQHLLTISLLLPPSTMLTYCHLLQQYQIQLPSPLSCSAVEARYIHILEFPTLKPKWPLDTGQANIQYIEIPGMTACFSTETKEAKTMDNVFIEVGGKMETYYSSSKEILQKQNWNKGNSSG